MHTHRNKDRKHALVITVQPIRKAIIYYNIYIYMYTFNVE